MRERLWNNSEDDVENDSCGEFYDKESTRDSAGSCGCKVVAIDLWIYTC